MLYGARVTIRIEYDDGFGPADGLDLDFAGMVEADSALKAMKKVAAGLDEQVKEKLA